MVQACTQYTGRLPPKQLGFGTSQSVQFVEQRRTLLDAYLQYIVADPVLASMLSLLALPALTSKVQARISICGTTMIQV